MTWTTTIPTEPGYYWWRVPNHGAVIVVVVICGGIAEVMLPHGTEWRRAETLGGEWAGPIEEPKE